MSVNCATIDLNLRELARDGGRLRYVVSERGLGWADGRHAGQLRCLGSRGHWLVQRCNRQHQLQTVLDPEKTPAMLPVLHSGEKKCLKKQYVLKFAKNFFRHEIFFTGS